MVITLLSVLHSSDSMGDNMELVLRISVLEMWFNLVGMLSQQLFCYQGNVYG
jgi:hypothetical protein